MLMTPGDIVMMLNEMGGMRVQATSPSLGAASVRIQGMRGRYTRVLSDGLPLFGEVGGLGPAADSADGSRPGRGDQGRRVGAVRRRRDGRRRQSALAAAGDGAGARVPGQSLDARRDRCRGVPVGAARRVGGAPRCSAAGTGRRRNDVERRRAGPTCRATRAPWSARASSGTDGDGRALLRDRRLHLRGSRAAARPADRCCRAPASRTSKRSTRGAYDARRVGQFLLSAALRRHRARGGRAAAPRSSVRRGRSSAIGTTPRSAKSPCAAPPGRQTWVAGVAVERDAYTSARRAAIRTTRSPCPASSCRTTSNVDAVAVGLGERAAGSSTASTARSSARASSALRARGRWTSRLSVGHRLLRARRRSPKRPKRPA